MELETEKRGRGRPATGTQFPHLVRSYEDDEGMRLLKELARRRGLSQAALLRQLIREEAKREGVE